MLARTPNRGKLVEDIAQLNERHKDCGGRVRIAGVIGLEAVVDLLGGESDGCLLGGGGLEGGLESSVTASRDAGRPQVRQSLGVGRYN